MIRITCRFLLSIIISVLILILFIDKNKNSIDPFFLRITKKHNTGLILGTSRAAHCLDPDFLDGVGYNFSFAFGLSPYDSAYFNAVRVYTSNLYALENDSINNFILSVDPWVMSTFDGNLTEQNNGTFMSEIGSNVYLNCGIYLFKYMNLTPSRLLNYIIIKEKPYLLLNNGRLSYPMDKSSAVTKESSRMKITIQDYRNKNIFLNGKYSMLAENYLMKTIEYLRKYGRIYLVRLPTSTEMFNLENEMMPEFDMIMQKFALINDVRYINLVELSSKAITIDGNHIWDGHSEWISRSLNDSLNAF